MKFYGSSNFLTLRYLGLALLFALYPVIGNAQRVSAQLPVGWGVSLDGSIQAYTIDTMSGAQLEPIYIEVTRTSQQSQAASQVNATYSGAGYLLLDMSDATYGPTNMFPYVNYSIRLTMQSTFSFAVGRRGTGYIGESTYRHGSIIAIVDGTAATGTSWSVTLTPTQSTAVTNSGVPGQWGARTVLIDGELVLPSAYAPWAVASSGGILDGGMNLTTVSSRGYEWRANLRIVAPGVTPPAPIDPPSVYTQQSQWYQSLDGRSDEPGAKAGVSNLSETQAARFAEAIEAQVDVYKDSGIGYAASSTAEAIAASEFPKNAGYETTPVSDLSIPIGDGTRLPGVPAIGLGSALGRLQGPMTSLMSWIRGLILAVAQAWLIYRCVMLIRDVVITGLQVSPVSDSLGANLRSITVWGFSVGTFPAVTAFVAMRVVIVGLVFGLVPVILGEMLGIGWGSSMAVYDFPVLSFTVDLPGTSGVSIAPIMWVESVVPVCFLLGTGMWYLFLRFVVTPLEFARLILLKVVSA